MFEPPESEHLASEQAIKVEDQDEGEEFDESDEEELEEGVDEAEDVRPASDFKIEPIAMPP